MHRHGRGGSNREKRRNQACHRARDAKQNCRDGREQDSKTEIEKDMEVAEGVACENRKRGDINRRELIYPRACRCAPFLGQGARSPPAMGRGETDAAAAIAAASFPRQYARSIYIATAARVSNDVCDLCVWL